MEDRAIGKRWRLQYEKSEAWQHPFVWSFENPICSSIELSGDVFCLFLTKIVILKWNLAADSVETETRKRVLRHDSH